MNILPMTPQQLADARKEVNVEDVTVILKFFGVADDDSIEGTWNVFAYAPRRDDPSELVSLFEDDFEDFEEARTIAYALADNFECEVVVIDPEGDDSVLAPGERPTWMAP